MTQNDKNSDRQPSQLFYDALQESLGKIDLDFSQTEPSFKRDRAKTATAREESVADFLESFFPRDWSVKKGPIYDSIGNASDEVDCVLCVPQHPPCRTPKRDIILAEGVYAAVEVKPDISSLGVKGEFVRALRQGISVKKLQREVDLLPQRKQKTLPPGFHKIPYVIFSNKTASLKRTADYMLKYQEKNCLSPWDIPDIVVGYKTGIIFHAPEVSLSPYSTLFAKHGAESGDAYWLMPSKSDTLLAFLSLLYHFVFPQPIISEPILRKYLMPIIIPPGSGLLTPDK